MNGLHEATICRVTWDNNKEIHNTKEDKGKTFEPTKHKTPSHYIVTYFNVGVT